MTNSTLISLMTFVHWERHFPLFLDTFFILNSKLSQALKGCSQVLREAFPLTSCVASVG